MKQILVMAATLAGFLGTTLAHADMGGKSGKYRDQYGACQPTVQQAEQMMRTRLNKFLNEINATPQQRQQITPMVEQLFSEWQSVRSTHENNTSQFLSMWGQNTLDPKSIDGLVDSQVNSMKSFGYKMSDFLAKLHGVLNPQQRQIVADKVKKYTRECSPGAQPGTGSTMGAEDEEQY